jgi:hypothetical protein
MRRLVDEGEAGHDEDEDEDEDEDRRRGGAQQPPRRPPDWNAAAAGPPAAARTSSRALRGIAGGIAAGAGAGGRAWREGEKVPACPGTSRGGGGKGVNRYVSMEKSLPLR